MNSGFNRVALFLVSLVCMLGIFAGAAFANETRTFCVYDPSGANGDAFATMKDYQVAASAWGYDLELKPYTNEKTASDDFKAKKCDAVFLTGVRARSFNKFIATIEALGALPSYDWLEKATGLFTSPKVEKYLKVGDYETVLLMPMGAVYMFVRDRSVKSIEDLAGKRITTLDYDQAAKYMVSKAGASMVSADISTFAGMFNNGAADVCYSTTTAFKPLELEKGIAAKGGIIRYPIAHLTGQILIQSDKFNPEFGTQSRAWGVSNFKKILQLSTKADAAVPNKYWIEISKEDRERYDQLFLDVRVQLRDVEKVYDKQALKIMARLRCQIDNTRPECALKRE